MSQPPLSSWHAVSQAVCCASCRALLRHAERHVARPLRRIVAPPTAVPCLSRDTTQRQNRALVMIRPFVSRHNPPVARPSRACRSPLHTGRPCRRASQPCRRPSPWPYRGPIRLCPSHIVGMAATPCLLCHDTMHCIVTKAGKWAVAHPTARKKFFHSNYKKTTNIYIYIDVFFFIFQLNKINSLKFIFFFSSFTYCKTLEIFFFLQYTFFFI